jgi:uncharacterized membrane protein YebE (DUF533 family)
MFDPKKLLDQLMGSKVPGMSGTVRDRAGQAVDYARENPLKAGALAALLLGTGVGRGLTTSALKLGGLAAIAGLGYQAYKNYQQGNQPGAGQAPTEPSQLPPPGESQFHLDPNAADPDFALTLVRAMIAAAASDGTIDADERGRIVGKLGEAGVEAEAQTFIENEMANPVGLDHLVAAGTTEERKVEIYTASRLAVEADTRAERGYLDLLAGRLGLPDALVDHIEATVSGAKAGSSTPI